MNIQGKRDNFQERNALKEKNDCTVRALANGLEISYLEAYGIMIGLGRRRYKGCNISEYLTATFGPPKARPQMNVENYVKYIAHSGNWIIKVTGHVFAVCDGVIKDTYPSANHKAHVLESWKVK